MPIAACTDRGPSGVLERRGRFLTIPVVSLTRGCLNRFMVDGEKRMLVVVPTISVHFKASGSTPKKTAIPSASR